MSMRSYRRAMADSKVMFSLFDRVNRLLLRLSDRITESDHPLALSMNCLRYVKCFLQNHITLYICIISFRSVRGRDCAVFLAAD